MKSKSILESECRQNAFGFVNDILIVGFVDKVSKINYNLFLKIIL